MLKKQKLLFDTIGHKLIKLCHTRWVELHNTVIQFQKILLQLVIVLTKTTIWKESSMTTSKAKSLILSICDTDFIFTLIYLSQVLKQTLSLSKILQFSTVDFKNVSEIMQCTINALRLIK